MSESAFSCKLSPAAPRPPRAGHRLLPASPRLRVALTPSPPRPLTPSSLRRKLTAHSSHGFSLVELMIAIMILGLGMVMVATVFPVSLELTRGTLQLNIADAAFESAIATLKMRIPSRHMKLEPELPPTGMPDVPAEVVLWPDVRRIELDSNARIDQERHAVLFAEKYAIPAFATPTRIAFNDVLFTTLSHGAFAGHWTTYRGIFPDYTRAYTEQTYWDAEMHTEIGDGSFRLNSWVVRSVNITASGLMLPEELVPGVGDLSLPYIQNPLAVVPPRAARIHLADRVYPPINVEAVPDGSGYAVWNPNTNTYDFFPEPDALGKLNEYIFDVARERRYAWTAFARQGGNTLLEFKDGKRSFMCTIVLTYRGNLSARYARQQQPTNDRQFNFSNSAGSDFADDVFLMRVPRPDTNGPDTDTMFPQPWLVMLDVVNPKAGVITCTGAVARLLPVDSYFIVAQKNAGLQAGAPIKITGGPSYINPGNLADPIYTLEFNRFGFGMGIAQNVAVWVFPPAIDPANRGSFQRNSPVVATTMREVIPDWGK